MYAYNVYIEKNRLVVCLEIYIDLIKKEKIQITLHTKETQMDSLFDFHKVKIHC